MPNPPDPEAAPPLLLNDKISGHDGVESNFLSVDERTSLDDSLRWEL